ncbi:hypothetical protein SCB71_11480 [Herbiconiux sp. KACC 21604]|uniref:hypothetical protein n=1 Tax=unclassified Herbiconiux TaxID=2618217 RepID=UPI0014915851|nr:hypothetical protein [Herbiconiux sp. SALV-R1]QJU53833.1 hypothetical protein HL652_09430 [Herbiconiux sp. SALV-R1]WPO84844.1 hypothetical protein SCB71_11480 [Herbiconiux sp. KACC 21604]
MEPTESPITRRSVVAAGAWSLPVVALAVATPVAAASVAPTVTISITPNPAMNLPTEAYTVLTLTNTGSVPVVDPVQLVFSSDGPFRFNGLRGEPGWSLFFMRDGGYGMMYTGGIAAGASITNSRVVFRVLEGGPAPTTVTCIATNGATSDASTLTVLPGV